MSATSDALTTPANLQLINKDSFLSTLINTKEGRGRAVSGTSSDYGAAMSTKHTKANRDSIGSASSHRGFPSCETCFYNAQKDYVERFVLGIDPRQNEQSQHTVTSAKN